MPGKSIVDNPRIITADDIPAVHDDSGDRCGGDGRQVPSEHDVAASLDDDAQVSEICRNDAERDSERLLAAIDSVMVRTDAVGIVRRWNNRAAEVLGIRCEEAMGKRFDRLAIEWEDQSSIEELTGPNARCSSTPVEAQLRHPSGVTRIIAFSSYPVFDCTTYHGNLILGSDLTEHHRREQQRHNTQKLESIGQLAAGVAHEINTPLQFLGDNLNYVSARCEELFRFLHRSTQLLNDAEVEGFRPQLVRELKQQQNQLNPVGLSKEIPAAIKDSIEGIEHVSRIVLAMKELSHPGGDAKCLVDVNRALHTAMTVSTNEWKHVAEMESHLDPDLKSVRGFPAELHQVFLNIIVNAAQAISARTDGNRMTPGKISLRTMQRDGYVRVEISDTGGGIPHSIRDRVFDPFFTTKEPGHGTGHGLSIAHSVIVRKQRGSISFDVEAGVGTTFVIELPVSDVPTAGSPDADCYSREDPAARVCCGRIRERRQPTDGNVPELLKQSCSDVARSVD